MLRVTSKVALVTGAASNPGIGSATAQRLAQEGAKVFLTDIDLEGAERTATAIRSAGGGATSLKHDVTKQRGLGWGGLNGVFKNKRARNLFENEALACLCKDKSH